MENRTTCTSTHPREGYVCERQQGHSGKHRGPLGTEVWRSSCDKHCRGGLHTDNCHRVHNRKEDDMTWDSTTSVERRLIRIGEDWICPNDVSAVYWEEGGVFVALVGGQNILVEAGSPEEVARKLYAKVSV